MTSDSLAGDTVFSVTADDGVRLWVDGALLIDKWIDQPATTDKATKTLSAGSHQVKVEYYEHQYGAVAKASWTTGSTPPPPEPPVTVRVWIGTSSHTRSESDLRMLLQNAGTTWLRDDALWENVELTKGTFNWGRLDSEFTNVSAQASPASS